MSKAKTLYEKIWDNHVVREAPGEPALIYIDRHLIHEGTSPQAFAGLKGAGRKVRRPDLTFAVMDHSVPTKDRGLPVLDTVAAAQFDALAQNCRETGVLLFDMRSRNQGIVHIIGPELGITQPGQTIVCGDSHTSTHGAFGTLAFGIGTSEVEHVLATQCLPRSGDCKEAAARWKSVASDPGAVDDRVVELEASKIAPQVTWGTNPGMVTDVTGKVPDPGSFRNPVDREAARRALDYMGLEP